MPRPNYTGEAVYNKIWNSERPLINFALKHKGYPRMRYPKGSIAPYHSIKRLIHLMEKAEQKRPKRGKVKSSHQILEQNYKLPKPRNQRGTVARKKSAFVRTRGDREVEFMRHPFA